MHSPGAQVVGRATLGVRAVDLTAVGVHDAQIF
jgi:hypothetical protein